MKNALESIGSRADHVEERIRSQFKIITNVNFPSVGKEVQKANDTPNYLNAK